MDTQENNYQSNSYFSKFVEPPSEIPMIREGENIDNGIKPSQLTQHGIKSSIKCLYPLLLAKKASEESILWSIQNIILHAYYLDKETTKELIPEDWHQFLV
jgi:hypothetical protein